jgi:hypothetical protein
MQILERGYYPNRLVSGEIEFCKSVISLGGWRIGRGTVNNIKPRTLLRVPLLSLDVAATVEPLTPEPEQIRQELIDELKERALPSVRSTKRFLSTANCERRAISMSLTRPLTKGVPSATRAAFTGDLEKSPQQVGERQIILNIQGGTMKNGLPVALVVLAISCVDDLCPTKGHCRSAGVRTSETNRGAGRKGLCVDLRHNQSWSPKNGALMFGGALLNLFQPAGSFAANRLLIAIWLIFRSR